METTRNSSQHYEKPTRKQLKEKTRQGLVEQAEALFAKRGIGNTSTADIAKSLDVSHGTVFIHFPTRDDLVLAVVDRFGERVSESLNSRIADDMTLKELLRTHLSVLAEFEDFYMRLISEAQSLSPRIRSLVQTMNSWLSYRFYVAAREQMKRGEIKKIAQAPFFNTWMALIHHQILNRDIFSDETPILHHKGDEIIRHFLLLVKTP